MSYCVNCGVELADTEKKCPLCQTEVYNPKSPARRDVKALYPPLHPQSAQKASKNSVISILTILFLLPVALCVVCDLSINRTMVWSGYVIGSFLLLYIIAVLPIAVKMNPVVALSADGLGAIAFLFFIERVTDGNWFLKFAMPIALFLTAMVVLITFFALYTKIPGLVVTAIAFVLIGVFCVFLEVMINSAFQVRDYLAWSLYPLVTLSILSGALIYIQCSKPLREKLERKFFI